MIVMKCPKCGCEMVVASRNLYVCLKCGTHLMVSDKLEISTKNRLNIMLS
ncbi:MAG: hypothetical protein QXO67_03895 [Candidatus Bathyarchaeia archaeon]